MDLKALVRSLPDYPKPGVTFRDITPLLADSRGFRRTIDELVQPYAGERISLVAGIEARGFIVGGAVAHQLSVGFVPVRKQGKLPHVTIGEDYALEYGQDRIEIHADGVRSGDRVLIVDDLVATGGTATAAAALLRRAGAEIAGLSFVIELPALGGGARLRAAGYRVRSLLTFDAIDQGAA